MTAEMISFNFEHQHTVRTFLVDGEVLFMTADTCAVLGHRDASSALRMVESEEIRRFRRSDTPQLFRGIAPQVQEFTAVTEAGLYDLIFGSQVSDARRFKRWVTREVLPTIRRTGRYEVAPSSVAPTALETVEAMVRALRAEHDRNDQQDGRLDGLDERVETLDGRVHAIESAPPSDWMTVNVYAARTENSPNSRDYLNRLGATAARVCDEGDVQPHRSGPTICYPRWSLDRAAERLRTPDHERPTVPTLSLDEARRRSEHKKITGQFTLFDASPGDQPF